MDPVNNANAVTSYAIYTLCSWKPSSGRRNASGEAGVIDQTKKRLEAIASW